MPVSRHRRKSNTRPALATPGTAASSRAIQTIDDLARLVADPLLAFPAKLLAAAEWWFCQMLRQAGGHPTARLSRRDRDRAAILLCVALDGQPGANDILSPVLAAMLRPWCPAASYTEAWELASRLPPGSVTARAARLLRRLEPRQPGIALENG